MGHVLLHTPHSFHLVLSLRLIHVTISVVFHCVYVPYFLYPFFRWWHPGRFHILAIVNDAAMNRKVQISLQYADFTSLDCIPRNEAVDHVVGLFHYSFNSLLSAYSNKPHTKKAILKISIMVALSELSYLFCPLNFMLFTEILKKNKDWRFWGGGWRFSTGGKEWTWTEKGILCPQRLLSVP